MSEKPIAMRMRALIFAILSFCLCSCGRHDVRLPERPATAGLIAPVFLSADSGKIDLDNYFPFPEKIAKITVLPDLKTYWNKSKQCLGIRAADTGALLSNIRIRYEGYDYDIPVVRCQPASRLHIAPVGIDQDTVFVRSNAPTTAWAVYLQNSKLETKFLCPKGDLLGIVLPKNCGQLKYANLRIWAKSDDDLSNNIAVPLRKGKVIAETQQLNSTSKESALLYMIELDATSNTEATLAETFQKVEEGYFNELGINTLCISFDATAGHAFARLDSLAEIARQRRIHVVWDSAGETGLSRKKPYWKNQDSALFEQAVVAFARPDASFKQLARQLKETLRYAEEDAVQVRPSGLSPKKRFAAYAMPNKTRAEGGVPLCRKSFQFFAFNATIPGIPMIYRGDEKCPYRGGEAEDEEQAALKAGLTALNKLRNENMALLYGDFLPVRVEDNIFAYLRTFFDRKVLVVFNKGEEPVSLRLDLPPMKEEENFRALFGNRFSCNNSKIILDVPASGIEIIFN